MRIETDNPTRSMELEKFFLEVYAPLRLVGRSMRTRTLYLYSIALFSEYLKRPAMLSDLTDIVVSQHIAGLIAVGYRPASVNKEKCQLCALWNLAARKKYVDEFPEVRAVPEPEVIPLAWSFEEMWRLRISCNFETGDYSGVPANKWWLALHAVLWTTGERITATMKLKFSEVQGDKIIFLPETRKGGVKANICSVPQYVVDAIETIREPRRAVVFVWPYSETYLYRVYGKILRRAELDTSARSKFHRIRRSHATHLTNAGGNATRSLGHSSAEVTAAYLDVTKIPSKADLLPHFGDFNGTI